MAAFIPHWEVMCVGNASGARKWTEAVMGPDASGENVPAKT